MADYRTIKCPNCKDKDLGPYRVDVTNSYKVHGYCSKCHEQYTVIHGEGKISVFKGYR